MRCYKYIHTNNRNSFVAVTDNISDVFTYPKHEDTSTIDVALIPRSDPINCPLNFGYREKIGACSCEPHCSWDLCRLEERPVGCLHGAEIEWQWDNLLHAWVAQMDKGWTNFDRY